MKLFTLPSLLFAGLALFASSDVKSQLISFASNTATVDLPAGVTVENHVDNLKGKFGANQDHLIEISFLALPQNRDLTGVDFVKQQAEKKRVNIKETQGRVIFMEASGDSLRDGKTFRTVHWQIGVKEGAFVLTITAPVPMSKDFHEFLGAGLNQIVNTVSVNVLP